MIWKLGLLPHINTTRSHTSSRVGVPENQFIIVDSSTAIQCLEYIIAMNEKVMGRLLMAIWELYDLITIQ